MRGRFTEVLCNVEHVSCLHLQRLHQQHMRLRRRMEIPMPSFYEAIRRFVKMIEDRD